MKVAWKRIKTSALWTARILLSLVILFALMMGFGTSGSDVEKMRLFADAVEKWQHNPDFRQVQVEYVEMGSEAMRSKLAFVNSKTMVMWLRSLPGLPKDFKVNDTSLAHYTNFTLGPLSAYMHLTAEQGLTDTLKVLNYLGSKEQLTDDDIRRFLGDYKLYNPVVADDGAVESVRTLINDIDASRKFDIDTNVSARITPHIAAIASRLGYPTQIKDMNVHAQRDVWQLLDSEIRENDYELWRTKQANDWLNGVWAQVYGSMYSGVIRPTLALREICRITGPVLLMAWVGLGLWKRRKLNEAPNPLPRLALEGPEDLK
ncbi:MAG: hypothetical protein JWN40_506 [Phycisphaerales bacterium]|nr:hypothetical protein [Phycisphaerales bacterium]